MTYDQTTIERNAHFSNLTRPNLEALATWGDRVQSTSETDKPKARLQL